MSYTHTVSLQRRPPTPPSLWARTWTALRSSWTGPLSSSSPEIAKLLGAGSGARAGVLVNEETALHYAPFFSGVSLIASDVASLPLFHYKRLNNGGRERLGGTKLNRVLHDEFNPEMSAMVAREVMQAHCLTWGNAYAEIERNGAGEVVALWPLAPNAVTIYRERTTQRLLYRVSGGMESADVVLEARDVLHVPGLGFDGVCGYSVIALARESIGLGLATEAFGSTFFGNGSTFGGIIEYPVGAGGTELARKNFRESVNAQHTGLDRAHRFLALYDGGKYQALGIPPDHAQFLETRKFQIEEQARWLRLPPHKIGALEHATFSNIEHQELEYYRSCLRSWLVRWEQEFNRKLIPALERRQQFTEHVVDGILRGDIQSRYAAYAVGRQWGWLSANDICERENLNPLPNGQGDIYLVPANMWPADKIPDPTTKPAAPPTTEPGPTGQPTGQPKAPTPEEVNAIQEALETARLDAATVRGRLEEVRADQQTLVLASQEAQVSHTTTLEALRQELTEKDRRITTLELLELDAQTQLERAEQAHRDAAVAAEARAARTAGELAAHRAVYLDVWRRMIDREIERGRRAQGTPAKLRAWVETFYAGHEDLCLRTILPAMKVHCAWMAFGEDAETVARRLVREQVTDSIHQLESVLDGDAEALAPSLHALFERWSHDRASDIADRLLEREVDRARTRD